MNRKTRKQWTTNRDISKRPKKIKFWCMGCDRCLVGESYKCRVCGTRNGNIKRRLKRDV